MATLSLTLFLRSMKTHTAKCNTEMQDTDLPTLRDMDVYSDPHRHLFKEFTFTKLSSIETAVTSKASKQAHLSGISSQH